MRMSVQDPVAGAAAAAAALPALTLVHLLLTAGILAAAVVLGLVAQKVFGATLHAWAKRSQSEWDDIVADSMKGLVVPWFVLIGLAVVLRVVPLQPEIALIVRRTVGVLGILTTVIFFTRMARKAIYVYIDRKVEVPSSIFKNFATGLIYLVGFVVVLDYLGVSIAPLLTALGVSGLAVALALQDTLSNLFAGLNILMTRKIRPGDYISLETGQEGIVCDVTWRNTTIRAPEDNLVVVPNAKLAAAIYTNTHLPEQEMGLFLPVVVAFDSDLALVERVTNEVAREVLATPERAIPDFKPFIRYNAFTDNGVRFSVILRIKEYREMYPIRHEFFRRLHERYRAEGVKLAVPPRAVTLDKS
jgi:small-conductance mechanosensitive channel